MSVEFKRSDRFVYRNVAGEHLLVALHRGRTAPVFTFTVTGAAIWEHLTEWSTSGALADTLVSEYEVTLDQATSDVDAFLEQLTSLGALETREVA